MKNMPPTPVVIPLPSRQHAVVLGKLLALDGFPVVVTTGTVRGKEFPVVSTVAPRPLAAEYSVMASLAVLQTAEQREELYAMVRRSSIRVAEKLNPYLASAEFHAKVMPVALNAARNAYDPGSMVELDLDSAEELPEERRADATHVANVGLQLLGLDIHVSGSNEVSGTAPPFVHVNNDPGDEDPAEFRNGIVVVEMDEQDTYPAHRISRDIGSGN